MNKGLAIFGSTVAVLGGFAFVMSIKHEKEVAKEIDVDISKVRVVGVGTTDSADSLNLEVTLDFRNLNESPILVRDVDLAISWEGTDIALVRKDELYIDMKSVTQVPVTVNVQTTSLILQIINAARNKKFLRTTMGISGDLHAYSTTTGTYWPIDIDDAYDITELLEML